MCRILCAAILILEVNTFALLPNQRLRSLVRIGEESWTRTSSTSQVDEPQSLSKDEVGIPPIEKFDAVVCGGGPAGLLSAIMLAQKLPQSRRIRVYDRLGEPPSPDDDAVWNDVAKFYLIGIGGRGQSALKKFGVWDEVEKRSVKVVGRRDWAPGGPPDGSERVFTEKDKRVMPAVLPRDKLVGVLHKHILENYEGRIVVEYGYELIPIDFAFNDGSQVLVRISKCADTVRLNPSSVVKVATEEPVDVLCDVESGLVVATDLLVAADGTVRTVANAMEKEDEARFAKMNSVRRLFAGKPFKVKRYVDDNQRVYKTIPMKLPPEWRPDLNYAARSKGAKTTLDALPANANGDYCGVLLLRKDDELARADTEPARLRQRLNEVMPQFSALLADEVVATVAKKPVSYLPGFRYAGPRLHQGNRCLLIGDCVHTVKPYFGLGANSALESVKILGDILDKNGNDLTKSILEYSKRQAREAKTLVRISRDLDRPGKLGVLTFLVPLILDSIFHQIFPQIFQQNIIAMLQRESYTFRQVSARKRADRIGQLGIIALVIWSLAMISKAAFSRLSAWTGLKLLATIALSGSSIKKFV